MSRERGEKIRRVAITSSGEVEGREDGEYALMEDVEKELERLDKIIENLVIARAVYRSPLMGWWWGI